MVDLRRVTNAAERHEGGNCKGAGRVMVMCDEKGAILISRAVEIKVGVVVYL